MQILDVERYVEGSVEKARRMKEAGIKSCRSEWARKCQYL
jgi:glyoxylate carboligase